MSHRLTLWLAHREIRRRVSGIPDTGSVDLGQLRWLTPFGCHSGEDRGLALNRYPIADVLGAHALDVRGRAREIREDRDILSDYPVIIGARAERRVA
jgi:hypothetical protein